jgi:hypothetical protein
MAELAEGTALEKRQGLTLFVGSNPTLTANSSSRRSTDRTQVSGTCDAGSIPAESTITFLIKGSPRHPTGRPGEYRGDSCREHI